MKNTGYLKIESCGEIITKEYNDLWQMLYVAASVDCFEDCGAGEIKDIEWEDRKIYYCGWMPNMHYRYCFEDTNEIAFDEYFPDWDH